MLSWGDKLKAQDIKKVACIGAGVIGASWATLYLWKGYEVFIQDISEESLERARQFIKRNFDFLVEKKIITKAQRESADFSATFTTSIEESVIDSQFVQESAFESYEVKEAIVQDLDKYAPEAIYASSTSGLLISEIQKYSKYPGRCITAHPFNPPHLIPLVELVKGQYTDDETVRVAYDFFKSIDKEPIVLNKEIPGHIASRIQLALWRECADLVLNGVCTVKDVDLACCYGPGLRWALMGPHLIWDLANPKGIAGTIDHIGPSMNMWLPDMANWTEIPTNAGQVMQEGLQEEVAGKTLEEIKIWRDEKIIGILKMVGKL